MLLPAFPRFFLPFCTFLLSAPLLTSSARALPTTNPLPGITGLGVIPTTDTITPGNVETSLGYERVKLRDNDGDVDFLPLASVNYGVKRGEVGATYLREDSDIQGFSERNSYYALQGKIRVYERRNLGVALGAHYLDFGNQGGADLGNLLSGYATGSVVFPDPKTGEPRVRAHGGMLLQRVRGGGSSDTTVRPFAGAEYLFSPNLSLAADYLFEDDPTVRALSLSLRFTPQNSPFGAQIGVGKLSRDSNIFLGLSYVFGR